MAEAATGETPINWQDYLAVVIRRQWFVIFPCAVIVAATMITGFLMPRIYRSETVLLVQDPKIMNPLIKGMAVARLVEARMRIVQEELLGWSSLSQLIKELGLDRQAKSPAAFESVIRRLQRDIVVTSKVGGLIRMTYDNPDPALAQRTLNPVTDIYVRRNMEASYAEADTAIQFIESEMVVYKQKLEASEQALREFRELYVVDMPVATQLNRQVIALQVQLAQLLVENTEEHPTVVQVRRQIDELKLQRNAEIKRVIAAAVAKSDNPQIYAGLLEALEVPASSGAAAIPQIAEAQKAYQTWVEQMDSPQLIAEQAPTAHPQGAPAATAGNAGQTAQGPGDAIDELGAISITLAPRQEQELARLRRDYETYRNTYHELARRLERAKITQRLGESDQGTKFKIIEPARLPLRPVSPKLWIMFWSALGAGLFVGISAAFGAEYLDQSFQSAEDVQTALAVPVLGSISTIVTTGDVEARNRRIKGWLSVKAQAKRLHTAVWHPIQARLDRLLLRLGL